MRPAVLVWLLVGVCLLGGVGVAITGASEHDTQHEHPDDVGDDGNLTAVQQWLGGRMTEINLDCAENLSLTESVACERLDGEYPEYLSEYGSVERERTGSNETTETLAETGETQRELVNETNEFRETYQEYQAAQEAGDNQRARRLARELQNRSDRIEELSLSLTDLFRQLEAQTGRDMGSAINSTSELAAEVETTTRQVEGDVFTPTDLTADVASETASFRSPATVSGTLVDENGTALADRTIVLVVDGRVVATTRTDTDGTYTAPYRPVTTETGPTTITAAYRPAAQAEYLDSNATANVSVEAVEPSVSITTDVEEVAFRDGVPATATVSLEGVPAASVPVALFLGDERIARNRTADNGSVSLNGTVPANVPDGERQLTVRVSREGTALSPVSESQSVTVLETETRITIEGLLDGEELVLTGRLTTADGQPVSAQQVGVNVDGQIRRTTTTDELGSYERRVPRSTGDAGEWSVAADYANSDSNLAPVTTTRTLQAEDLETTAGTTVDASRGPVERARAFLTDNALRIGGVVGFLAIAAAALIARRRLLEETDEETTASDDGEDDMDEPTPGDDQPPVGTGGDTASDADDIAVPDADFLAVARQRLGDGAPSEAVRIGYGAVRSELLRRTGDTERDTRTHWEFYRDVRSELPEHGAAALETLTEAYERAAFAPSGVDETTAESAVEAAAECLDSSAATDGGSGDER